MHTTKIKHSADQAEILSSAKQVVESVPGIMRMIRSGVRKSGLISLPQLRVLAFISRNPGAGVSDVGAALDVTNPTASALVDRLVRKHLVTRKEDPSERRRTLLTLTDQGKVVLEEARQKAQLLIAELLQGKTTEQLSKINEGLAILAEAARAYNA